MNKTSPSWIALALAVGSASCGVTGRYISPELKGDTPLAVENLWGGDMCRLYIARPGTPSDKMQNLLYSTLRGEIPMKPGEKATFNLKPGRYDLMIVSCLAGFEASKTLELQSPTYLGIAGPGSPPPGYAAITVMGGQPTLCTNAGGSMDDGRPCCSNRHHRDHGLEVCD